MKYVYTAIFTPVEEGYSVCIPDLPGCITSGRNIVEAMQMADDAGCVWLWDAEKNKASIPGATPINQITVEASQIKTLVLLDIDEYRRVNDNRVIKKPLTIPSWLNTMAEQAGIDFSQVLQEALKARLGIK